MLRGQSGAAAAPPATNAADILSEEGAPPRTKYPHLMSALT